MTRLGRSSHRRSGRAGRSPCPAAARSAPFECRAGSHRDRPRRVQNARAGPGGDYPAALHRHRPADRAGALEPTGERQPEGAAVDLTTVVEDHPSFDVVSRPVKNERPPTHRQFDSRGGGVSNVASPATVTAPLPSNDPLRKVRVEVTVIGAVPPTTGTPNVGAEPPTTNL